MARRRGDGGAHQIVGRTATVVLTILVTVGFSGWALGTAAAGPQIIIPPGGGGCWTYHSPIGITVVSPGSTTNATNATVAFRISSSSVVTNGYFNLSWGNSTSYPFRAFSNVSVGDTTPVSQFLNYLDPNWTYYYHIQGWVACDDSNGFHFYWGNDSGSFNTGADYTNVIAGTVEDVNGTYAPVGLLVTASCYNSGTDYGYSASGHVVLYGEFSITINSQYCYDYQLGYAVSVDDWCYWDSSCAANLGTTAWFAHWNETIVVWAPQNLQFILENVTQTAVPVSIGFVSAVDADTYLNLTSTSSTTTAYTVDLPMFLGPVYVGSYDVQTSTISTVTLTQSSGENKNFELFGMYNTTGNVLIDGIGYNRLPHVDWSQVWGVANSHLFFPTRISDPKTLSDYNKNSNCAEWMEGITGHTSDIASVGVAGSTTEVSGLNFSFSYSGQIDLGIAEAGVGAEFHVQATLSQTTGYSFAWNVWAYDLSSSQEFLTVCQDPTVTSQTGLVLQVFVTSSS